MKSALAIAALCACASADITLTADTLSTRETIGELHIDSAWCGQDVAVLGISGQDPVPATWKVINPTDKN